MNDPIHRDDVPMDLSQEIERQFAESHPGMKVVFVGDLPGELPPEVAERVAAIERLHMESLFNGACLDCGAKMPNWPETPEGMDDTWQPAPGWRLFTDMRTKEPSAWQCPACDTKDGE